jgi:hypothetical protein
MASPTVAALTGGAAPLVLDEAAAARTWNAILARQGLADSSPPHQRLPGR